MTLLESTVDSSFNGATDTTFEPSLIQSAWRFGAQPVDDTDTQAHGADRAHTQGSNVTQCLISWRSALDAASQPVHIIALLRLLGRARSAERLTYLHSLETALEPDEAPMVLDSVKLLCRFLLNERQLTEPEIGLSPDGSLQAEWRLKGNGILAMKFLAGATIRFTAISAPAMLGVQRRSINGTLPLADIMSAIKPFTSELLETA